MIQIDVKTKSLFLKLYQMALIDDDFHPSEMVTFYKIGAEKGVPKEEMDKILITPLSKLEEPQTELERLEYLYHMTRIIIADNRVTEEERKSLEKFCIKFNIEESSIPELIQNMENAAKNGKVFNDFINELNK